MNLNTDIELTQSQKRSKARSAEDFSPFIAAQESIWDSDLTTSEKIVLLAILSHWSRKSPIPYPGIETLQDRTGLGRAAVFKAIKNLETKGVIRVIRRIKEANRYDMTALFAGHLGACTKSSCVDSPVHQVDSPVHQVDCRSPRRSTRISPTNISNEDNKEELGADVARGESEISVLDEPETESYRLIKNLYLTEYGRVHGEQPVLVLGDMQALRQLLKSAGKAKAERAIRNAFANDWSSTRTTIQQIRNDPTKYVQMAGGHAAEADHYQVDDKKGRLVAVTATAVASAQTQPAIKRDDVMKVHSAWKVRFGRDDVLRDPLDAQAIAEVIDLHGIKSCLAVAYYAPEDGMVSGRDHEKGTKHQSVKYIFGNENTFGRILKFAKDAMRPRESAAEKNARLKAM